MRSLTAAGFESVAPLGARRPHGRIAAVCVLLLTAVIATRAHAVDGVVPGRIIVKYNDSLTVSAADLLANAQPFAAALTDGSNSLDQLNQALGVTAAREVFVSQHGISTSQARANFKAELGAVMARFPQRTARIAADTPPPPDPTNIYVLSIPSDQDPYYTCGGYAQDPHVVWCQPDYVPARS